jgi:hypothetical protein
VRLFQEIPEFDEVRRTRSRADGGIDLVAVNKTPFVGGRVAIQAKRYAELYEGERLLWVLRHHLHREYTIVDQSRRKPPFKRPPQSRTTKP